MIRVLFLCERNDSSSQIAEGLFNKIGGKDFKAFSAGLTPSSILPETVQIMAASGLNPNSHRAKPIADFSGQDFDYLIWLGEDAPYDYPLMKGERVFWHLRTGSIEGQVPILLTRIQLFMLSHHDVANVGQFSLMA